MVQKNSGGDPAVYHYQVTFSNTVPLSPLPRFLYAANAGTITITDPANTTFTYTVTAGQRLDIRAYIVRTDSTANTVAWY